NRLDGAIKDGVFTCAAGRLPVSRADNAAISLFFRPETAIMLAEGAEAAPFAFMVDQIHFLGSQQRLFLKPASASANTSTQIVVEVGNKTALSIGSRVGVNVAPSDLLFL